LTGVALLTWYAHAILLGSNSLSVLTRLQKEKAQLIMTSRAFKNANQKLQKKYFELIQLNSN